MYMYFCAPETIQKVITRNRCNFKYDCVTSHKYSIDILPVFNLVF